MKMDEIGHTRIIAYMSPDCCGDRPLSGYFGILAITRGGVSHNKGNFGILDLATMAGR